MFCYTWLQSSLWFWFPFLIFVFLFISNSCRTTAEYFSGELIEGRFCEDGQL